MSQPLTTTYVRHGQSEGNVVNKEPYTFPENYQGFPSNLYQLTRKGVAQSESAGKWIRDNIPSIDAVFSSPSPRVLQTLEYSNILDHYGLECQIILRLIEQYWGSMDNAPYEKRLEYELEFMKKTFDELSFVPPGGGETMAVCQLRMRDFHSMLCRQYSDQNVIVFTHGGIMEAHAADMLKINGLDFHFAATQKIRPFYIRNCQITQYTRQNPETDVISDKYTFFRSVCPWDPTDEAVWEPIVRPRYNQKSLSTLNQRTRDEQIFPALLKLGVDTEYLQNL